MKRLAGFDAILSGLQPIPISGRPAGKQMWVAPELLESLRRPHRLQLELPRRIALQVDDQIDLPKPPARRR